MVNLLRKQAILPDQIKVKVQKSSTGKQTKLFDTIEYINLYCIPLFGFFYIYLLMSDWQNNIYMGKYIYIL